MPFTLNEDACLAVFSRKAIKIVQESTGEVIGAYPWTTSYDVNAADPIPSGSLLFFTSGYGSGAAVVDFGPTGTEADRPADRASNRAHGVSAESVTRELAQAGFEAVTSEPATGQWFMVVASKPKPGA